MPMHRVLLGGWVVRMKHMCVEMINSWHRRPGHPARWALKEAAYKALYPAYVMSASDVSVIRSFGG